ncbi:MAG TPA: Lrp/AsnC ligand binding domain-containing protein [Nitrososphaeraceae archaeon]|jgi:DNA-binding Lrp family transcriptional regulator|nr:Lrp/AsnC ligand binding domain-containing protein [Nitrososphaeraceae archaeon]
MPLAYLLINCEHGEEQGIIEELKELPEIVEAYQIAGAYDLIAKINAATIDKLKETISWRIRTTDKIKSTITLIAIEGKS